MPTDHATELVCRLADRLDILEVLARLTWTGDFGDVEQVPRCYTADGYFDVSGLPLELNADGRTVGHIALKKMYADIYAANQGQSRHWIGSTYVEFGGSGAAVASSYFMIIRVGHAPGSGILLTGVYRDDLTRTGEGWRISGRRCAMDPLPEHRDATPTDVFVRLHDRLRPKFNGFVR